MDDYAISSKILEWPTSSCSLFMEKHCLTSSPFCQHHSWLAESLELVLLQGLEKRALVNLHCSQARRRAYGLQGYLSSVSEGVQLF